MGNRKLDCFERSVTSITRCGSNYRGVNVRDEMTSARRLTEGNHLLCMHVTHLQCTLSQTFT